MSRLAQSASRSEANWRKTRLKFHGVAVFVRSQEADIYSKIATRHTINDKYSNSLLFWSFYWSICVKSTFNEMIPFCTKQSSRVDTRERNHTEMIRFCTKRFGSAASCITRSHGLDSFLFQTRLVLSGAKMVYLFR